MMELVFGLVGVAGFVLALLAEVRARRTEARAAREALSGAGAAIADELAVLTDLAEAPTERGEGTALRALRRGASLTRLCALCERAEDLKAGLLLRGGGLPDGAADHMDGLLADADRALREVGRGDAPTPGLAPWRAEKLAAALRAS